MRDHVKCRPEKSRAEDAVRARRRDRGCGARHRPLRRSDHGHTARRRGTGGRHARPGRALSAEHGIAGREHIHCGRRRGARRDRGVDRRLADGDRTPLTTHRHTAGRLPRRSHSDLGGRVESRPAKRSARGGRPRPDGRLGVVHHGRARRRLRLRRVHDRRTGHGRVAAPRHDRRSQRPVTRPLPGRAVARPPDRPRDRARARPRPRRAHRARPRRARAHPAP